ncbi:succinate dehydrogenase, cytochrome b556 subunit [Sphingomonas aerophila]|nr:succinate dehydrogenase, cytochrome b556 subunit [Sphingomonas aerophila]
MASRSTRPISPHLQVYKWGPHMLVSVLHRITGSGMATVGSVLLVWWLAALAGGAESYATFRDVFTYANGRLNIIGYVIGIGLTLALFQHMASGVRHLFLDTGAGYELKRNKMGAMASLIISVVATAAFWLILGIK